MTMMTATAENKKILSFKADNFTSAFIILARINEFSVSDSLARMDSFVKF